MPEVVVYLAEGRTIDQKRGLVKGITDAVVKNCDVEPGVVTVSIMETPKMNKAKGGVLFSEMTPKK
jgi:4-oxalocrotonate tautomerase